MATRATFPICILAEHGVTDDGTAMWLVSRIYPNRMWQDVTFTFVFGNMEISRITGLLLRGNFNTLRPRRGWRHFADDSFRYIFLNENIWILIKLSLKSIAKGPINNIPALVQIMAWRRPGDKPLSEAMMVRLLTHIYVAWPQWVKRWKYKILKGISIHRVDELFMVLYQFNTGAIWNIIAKYYLCCGKPLQNKITFWK